MGDEMPTENRASRAWILPTVWQIMPPPDGFTLSPEQYRRRADDLRAAGWPDAARHHDNLAKIVEHRRRRMH
jgi:hypothetical protein